MRQGKEPGTVEMLLVFEHAEHGVEEFAHDGDTDSAFLSVGLPIRNKPTVNPKAD